MISLHQQSPANKEFRVAVVVPAYNEERLIGDTLRGIPSYVDKIYVVDDASSDGTGDIVRGFNDPRITLVRHEKNQGVGGAISTGYKLALKDRMDMAAVMAGDNQMDPDRLILLLEPIMEGRADYTKGNRLVSSGFRKGMSAWRSLGNYMLTFLNKIASGYWHIEDPQNGFTAISARSLAMLDLDGLYKGYAFENDMLVKLNVHDARVINIPIPARYGLERSKIRYMSFIVKTSLYFIEAVIWRSWNKYVVRLNPIGLLYIVGSVLIIAGLVALVFSNLMLLVAGVVLFLAAMAIEIVRNSRAYKGYLTGRRAT